MRQIPPRWHRIFSFFPSRAKPGAFTLVELLVVVAIMAVMMALVVPAFRKNSTDFTKAVYDISGILDGARSYAVANHTYVYVGFSEVDVSKPASTTPQPTDMTDATKVGRVVVAAVASKDGTRGYDPFNPDITWRQSYGSTGANLIAIGKMHVFENLHLAASIPIPPSGSGGNMMRYSITPGNPNLFGDDKCKSLTPFSLPIGSPLGSASSPGGKYFFEKVLTFDPQGQPSIQAGNVPGKYEWFEVGLQPTHGNVEPKKPINSNIGEQAAIMINGVTGGSRVFRP